MVGKGVSSGFTVLLGRVLPKPDLRRLGVCEARRPEEEPDLWEVRER